MILRYLMTLVCFLMTGFVRAKSEDPKPFFLSARLVVFPFDANASYTIYSRVGAITNITFTGTEQVKGLYLSDSVQWISTVTPDKQDIFIKPTQAKLMNAATVITSTHKYQLLLMSVDQDHVWYQRVSWYHNEDNEVTRGLGIIDLARTQKVPRSVSASTSLPTDSVVVHHSDSKETRSPVPVDWVEPTRLNFRYRMTGHADFRPELIFDDGQRTWMRLPQGVQHAPAVFEVSGEDKHLVVVNYAIHHGFYILPAVSSGWLLKLGKEEVRVLRIQHCSFFDFHCHHNLPVSESP